MIENRRHGFTLVELSIVLVIIGLLAAGILTGRDLIRAAQVRMQIAQIEQLNTAVNTFRTKYNCLPGDCFDAVDFGLAEEGGDGDGGNGNGVIDMGPRVFASVGVPIGIETQHLWYHLGRANLWQSYPVGTIPGINSASLKLPGSTLNSLNMGGQQNGNGGIWIVNKYKLHQGTAGFPLITTIENAWLLTSNTLASNSNWERGVYPAELAYAIDAKMDDGKPLSGAMYSISSGFQTFLAPVAVGGYYTARINYTAVDPLYPDACITTDDPQTAGYNLAPTGSADSLYRYVMYCLPIIKTQF